MFKLLSNLTDRRAWIVVICAVVFAGVAATTAAARGRAHDQGVRERDERCGVLARSRTPARYLDESERRSKCVADCSWDIDRGSYRGGTPSTVDRGHLLAGSTWRG